MVDNFKLFEKYAFNNNVVATSLLEIAPMTIYDSNPDGTYGEEEKNFYQHRATGIGLYILGATCVSQEGLTFENQPRAFNDADIPHNEIELKL